MRFLALLAGLVLAVPLAAARAGDAAPPRLLLKVGETSRLTGCAGRCDDTSVVTLTLDCSPTLTALKPGTTLCSTETRLGSGLRQVIQVVVEKQ